MNRTYCPTPVKTTVVDSRDCSVRIKRWAMLIAVSFFFVSTPSSSFSQAALSLSADSYVDAGAGATNFGSNTKLVVSGTGPRSEVYMKFDLASLAAGTAPSDIVRATLRIYANKVTTSMSSQVVLFPCGDWNENSITWNNRPGTCQFLYQSSNPISVANQYSTFDVTQAVRDWVSGRPNYGLSFQPNSAGTIVLDSKESGGNPAVIIVDLPFIKSISAVNGLTGSITNGNAVIGVAANGITTPRLGDQAVTSDKIADAAVSNQKLADGSVSTSKMAVGAVTNLQLANASVTEGKLTDRSVTTNKIGLAAVTTTNLGDGSVMNAKLANDSVDSAKLADSSVVSSKIASGQVVRSLNGLSDNVNIVAGGNITLTPSGNNITISATLPSPAAAGASALNLLQIATLRWFEVNESGPEIPVGNRPQSAAFDGANIWVVNSCSSCPSSVTKIRASDGQIIGDYPTGLGSIHVVYDGQFIWVSNRDSRDITKLRASDGSAVATYATGGLEPHWMAFDGKNIWISQAFSNNLVKFRASDGLVQGTYPTGTRPYGTAFDGLHIWVANNGSNTVSEYLASDGSLVNTIPVGVQPNWVTFDGSNIWVANQGSDTITKLRAADGTNLGTFAVGDGPYSMAFDGKDLWVANIEANTIMKVRTSDGSILTTSAVGARPVGFAFDGVSMWVVNYFGGSVTKR
jgi:hypothetical protein